MFRRKIARGRVSRERRRRKPGAMSSLRWDLHKAGGPDLRRMVPRQRRDAGRGSVREWASPKMRERRTRRPWSARRGPCSLSRRGRRGARGWRPSAAQEGSRKSSDVRERKGEGPASITRVAAQTATAQVSTAHRTAGVRAAPVSITVATAKVAPVAQARMIAGARPGHRGHRTRFHRLRVTHRRPSQ